MKRRPSAVAAGVLGFEASVAFGSGEQMPTDPAAPKRFCPGPPHPEYADGVRD
jgi:hypothetical protein